MIKKLSKKGFTLTELMVVVLILGILAAFAIPQYLTSLEITRAREAIDLARQWQNARDIFYSENGYLPRQNNLNILGLVDPNSSNANSPTMFISYFFLDLRNSSGDNIDRLILKRNLSGSNTYVIYATDNDLFCCWQTEEPDKYKKLCQNLISNESDTTDFSYESKAYNCYTLGQSD